MEINHTNKAESALILAGGQGSRMGYDKKLLKINGICVIEELINKLRFVFSEILVSTNRINGCLSYKNVHVLYDDIGSGPLAGIYQGLKYCKSDYLYVIACDMPFISLDYIRYIKEIICSTQVDACVSSRNNGFYEPFNSFYNKNCLSILHNSIMCGEYKISLFLEKLNLYVVRSELTEKYKDMFFNINSKEDLECAARMFQRL